MHKYIGVNTKTRFGLKCKAKYSYWNAHLACKRILGTQNQVWSLGRRHCRGYNPHQRWRHKPEVVNKVHEEHKDTVKVNHLHMSEQLVRSPEAGKRFTIFGTNDVYACFHSAPSDKVAGTENRACWEMRHGHLMAQSVLPLTLPWAKKGEGG